MSIQGLQSFKSAMVTLSSIQEENCGHPNCDWTGTFEGPWVHADAMSQVNRFYELEISVLTLGFRDS